MFSTYAEVKEEDEDYVSPLDLLFRAIEREKPDSVAVRQYKVFKLAAGKTSKSILVSTAVRLAPFNLPQIQAITDHDDMDLYTLGEGKVALYAVIPDNDNSFNFLVSLLYAQAFQALYYSADQIHHGALPRHVHFVLDEFAAMPLPGFTRELATMRSRNISASTIIQNMAQIKERYESPSVPCFSVLGDISPFVSGVEVGGQGQVQLQRGGLRERDREAVLPHDKSQAAAIVPVDLELARIVDADQCPLRAGRDGPRIAAHLSEFDAAAWGILLPQKFQPLSRWCAHAAAPRHAHSRTNTMDTTCWSTGSDRADTTAS